MSHFNVCVLLVNKGASVEDMAQEASDKLLKFDVNKEMEPYKMYIEADDIHHMADYFGIDPTNLHALAEKLEDWNGNKGGVDEGGFYGISTYNLDGRTDYWSVIAEVKAEDRGRLLFGEGGEFKVVKAVVTPEGKWINGPLSYGYSREQDKEFEDWGKEVTSVLEEYKDAIAFLVDCHI